MKTNHNLPEWAFLDAHSHLGNPLGDRTIILHIRSASVIEIIDRDHGIFIPAEGILSYKYKYNNGVSFEQRLAVLHYCATLDRDKDSEIIKSQILKPCAMWYSDYCAWEDNNILNDIFNGE